VRLFAQFGKVVDLRSKLYHLCYYPFVVFETIRTLSTLKSNPKTSHFERRIISASNDDSTLIPVTR
jgi:hypothetical protein